jgi:hypothetical protein
MEDVRDVYHRPFDPKRPLVGRDETSKQLIGEVAEPVPAEPGRPERIDSEYVRNGTAYLFLIPEPWAGWRHVEVTERRTAKSFADVVRWVVEDLHPDAEKIVLVIDDLNTHKLCVAVRGIRAGAGAADRRAAGGASHAEARQLAEHGGDRAERTDPAVPGPAGRHAGGITARGIGVGGSEEQAGRGDPVAVHHG